MMRRLSYSLLILLAILVSCTTSKLDEPTGPYIELSVSCGEPVDTKAGNDGTSDGVDRYNENLLQTIDFFFYPGDTPDRDAAATFHFKATSGKRSNDVFRIVVTPEDINEKIFPATPVEYRKVTVLAIANYPGTLVADENNLSGTSLNTLEAIKCTADFVSPTNHKQTSFLMSGTTVLSLRGRSQIMTATGSIGLERYACKVTVGVNVSETVTLGNGEIWSPILNQVEVYLVNGVNSVKLSGINEAPGDGDYFDYSANRKRFVSKDQNTGELTPLVGKTGDYYDTYPMYTYPLGWTYGSNEGSDREPYLKLVVPWRRHDANGFYATQRQLYYKVVMPDDDREGFARKFVRNNWYHLNIDVGILGAETDEATVVLTGSCYLVYWQQKDFVVKQAEIGNARYLSVEKSSYVLNNVSSAIISYTTSHPVSLKDIEVTRPYFGDKTSGEVLGGTIKKSPNGTYYLNYDLAHRQALNNGEDWFTDTGTSIVYTRELTNDYTQSTFDYSPFYVSFKIVHEDRPNDAQYTKEIDLTQYPAIFIEAIRNSDDTFVNTGLTFANKKIHASEHWGYVYVDGLQIVRSQVYKNAQGKWEVYPANNADITKYLDYFRSLYPNDVAVQNYTADDFHWRVVWYTGGSLDIFKMNITMLPPGTEGNSFVIGDPRTKEVNNLDGDWHSCDALYGASPRTLQYYYPAEGSDRTINMMAPSYCIASKCGGVEFDNVSKKDAELRCASYQEDGFPAGRWRLPTRGEIEFIAKLSANNAITYLFSSGSTYWSANGAIKVGTGTVSASNNTTALMRCVYDTWYWGDGQHDPRDQFVWGDMPR